MKNNYLVFLFFYIVSSVFSLFFAQEIRLEEFEVLEKNIERIAANHGQTFALTQEYIKKAKYAENNDELIRGYVLATYYAPPKQQITYSDSIITVAVKTKDKRYIGMAYITYANANFVNYNYKKTLEASIIGEEYLKNEESKEFSYKSEINFGKLKFAIGEYEDARKIVDKIYKYYKWKLNTKNTTNVKKHYFYNLVFLININASLKNFKENETLLKEGYTFRNSKENVNIEDSFFKLLTADAINDYNLGKYKSAVEKLQTSLKTSFENNYKEYYYLGMSFWKLNDDENAKIYFDKILDYYNQNGKTSLQFRPAFQFYVDYYKKSNNNAELLKATDKLLDFENKAKNIENEINYDIKKQYDEKKLIDEKTTLENDRKTERWIAITALLVVLISFFTWQFFNKKRNTVSTSTIKKYEKPEDSNSQHLEISTPTKLENAKTKEQTNDDEEEIIVRPYSNDNTLEINYKDYLPINKLTVKQILKSLQDFENKNRFLESEVKLTTIASLFNTNEKYLSKVIKVKTGKNFNAYINDLRFEYLSKKLQEDPDFKQKKIRDISKLLGFGTPEVFATLFKEKYDITPSEHFSNFKKI